MKIYRIKPYTGDHNAFIESTGFPKEIVFKNLDGLKLDEIETFKFVIKNKTKQYPDLLGTGSSEFFVTDKLKSILENYVGGQKINFIEFNIEKNNIGF